MIQTCEINTLRYNPELCSGCGLCLDVCPHGVFAANGKRVTIMHGEDCMGCGACQINCATGAIQVDSGVGCAYAMMRAALLGKKEPSCG